MRDEQFDEGLVHAHLWATEKPARPAQKTVIPARSDDQYDDGLVHSHAWASRGQ